MIYLLQDTYGNFWFRFRRSANKGIYNAEGKRILINILSISLCLKVINKENILYRKPIRFITPLQDIDKNNKYKMNHIYPIAIWIESLRGDTNTPSLKRPFRLSQTTEIIILCCCFFRWIKKRYMEWKVMHLLRLSSSGKIFENVKPFWLRHSTYLTRGQTRVSWQLRRQHDTRHLSLSL